MNEVCVIVGATSNDRSCLLGDKSWRDGIDEKCNFFSQNSLFNSLLLARKLSFLRKIRADAQILLTKLLISDNSANFRAGNEENNS